MINNGQSAAKPRKGERSETISQESTAILNCGKRQTYCIVKIYALKDPDTLLVRYIGATSQTLRRRLQGHLWDARHKRTQTHKTYWIGGLLKQGKEPLIELIEECGQNWAEREKYWYSQYSNLVNTIDGGGGVFKKDFDSIKRSSEAKFQPILQFDLQGNFIMEWECIRDASLAVFRVTKSPIKKALLGGTASAGGFIWKYKNKVIVPLRTKPQPNRYIRLHKDGNVIFFKSLQEFSRFLNVSPTPLYRQNIRGDVQYDDIVRLLLKIRR